MPSRVPASSTAVHRATSAYLAEVAKIRRDPDATEHAYRPALQKLLEAHLSGWEIINEPAPKKYGAPDFAAKKNGVALGFVEAKIPGANLNAVERDAQMTRYRGALSNLILTDHAEFRHYADGEPRAVVKLANPGNLRPSPNGATELAKLLKDFAALGESGRGESPDARRLAQMMAGKTRLLRDLVEKTVAADPESELAGIYEGLRENLIRGLKLSDFADVFAQTAAYGLFAARLESENQSGRTGEFNRLRAGELLPQTTPFLRRFFNSFAGPDMDEKISWMADDIAKMFASASMDNVVRAFASGGAMDDPFLHFYETFLREYDPKKRQSRGVYFTPRPVVDFIVRAVDYSLVNDFGIRKGLADESAAEFDGRKMHKVQILDPAAGTGAFLARVAELVHDRVRKNAGAGGWKNYAPEHLLPRLHGFEILMSAYAMCHLKMSLTLGKDIGGLFAKARGQRDFRVNVFLASALEAPRKEAGNDLFLRWLRDEAQAADRVKVDTPVMVVLGNPPYNVSTQNKGEWISKKLEDYKKGLDERHLNLDDDYVKFIRCAEHFIEKNGRGIIAMITNNSFLDGITHREMRKHLLETFDQIRILNLHGNAIIQERALDGGVDRNVFNIRQGVGIFVMTKTGKKGKGKNARLFHAKLQGGREMKYDFLLRESVDSVEWRELRPAKPYYFFTPKKFPAGKGYEAGIGVRDLFRQNGSGVKTDRDSLFIDLDAKPLVRRMKTLLGGNYGDDFAALYNVGNSSGYRMLENLNRVRMAGGFEAGRVLPIQYRPFDERRIYYDPDLLSRPNDDTMRHLKGDANVALMTTRLIPANHNFTHAHVSRRMAAANAVGGWTYVFPLWIWEKGYGREVGETVRRANFREKVVEDFAARMGMRYAESESGPGIVSPEELFDYVYAVLHRPSYRARFVEFLRIGYPKIPPARDELEFRRTAAIGAKLRELHLLESPTLDDAPYPFSEDGENKVDNVSFAPDKKSGGATGRVLINERRHFAGVPTVAWNFSVGVYHPAQKWLKDRKGRSLSFDDQVHYRRIIASLTQTAALAKTQDKD